jgi:mono/diheme cytochrome c family protein
MLTTKLEGRASARPGIRPAKAGPSVLLVLALAAGLSGCRQDMHDTPRYRPYRASDFFADGSSARPLVEGTVARGFLREDTHLYEGKVAGQPATSFPFPITRADLDRGQERYNIYCAPCHGRTGEGNGMVVQRGYKTAASYHIDRLRTAPVGYFFDVMSNGFGGMPDYKAQIPVDDRWRIIAYIRALQLTHNAAAGDVPAEELRRLSGAGAGK